MTKTTKATENATPKTAVTDEHKLTAQATVTVTAGEDNKEAFTGVTVSIAKYAPKLFVGMLDGTEYASEKSATDLLATIVTMANGHIVKGGKAGFVHEKIEWSSTSNEKKVDTVWDDLSEKQIEALHDIAGKITENVDKKEASKAELLAATFEDADGIALAASILTIEGKDKPSAKDFARWQRSELPLQLKGKNVLSEHMAVSEMPADLRAVVPAAKASAKALSTWMGVMRKDLCVAIADKAVTAMSDDLAKSLGACESAQAAYDLAVADKAFATGIVSVANAHLLGVAQGGVAADEAGIASSYDDDKNAFDEAKEERRQADIALGHFADVQDGVALIETKALQSAIKAECDKLRAENSESAKAERESEAAVTAVAQAFADYTLDDAADHIATIVGVRDDYEDVLRKALFVLQDREEEAEAKAKAEVEKDKEDAGA